MKLCLIRRDHLSGKCESLYEFTSFAEAVSKIQYLKFRYGRLGFFTSESVSTLMVLSNGRPGRPFVSFQISDLREDAPHA